MKSEIKWIPCSEKLPKEEIDNYLVVVREKWHDDEDYCYDIDLAKNYGDYIDDFWDTCNDWNEGQEVHITHWAELPKIDDLLDILNKVGEDNE